MRLARYSAWLLAAALLATAAQAHAQPSSKPAGSEGTIVDAPPTEDGPPEQPGAEGAQDKPEPAETTQPARRPVARKRSFFDTYGFIIIMLGGFFLLYMFMGRSRRKQETRRRQMLASLKKGDKAVTVGGIIGTIIELRQDEITIKVDETNNIRMRFARWAVRGVGEEVKAEKPEQKK